MTSPYLHLPIRTHAEALAEKREDLRQEEMGRGSAAQEECDELEFLADKVAELRLLFVKSLYHSEPIETGADLMHDLIHDLRGTARDKREEEQCNR